MRFMLRETVETLHPASMAAAWKVYPLFIRATAICRRDILEIGCISDKIWSRDKLIPALTIRIWSFFLKPQLNPEGSFLSS